jgi:uncharacterized protein involved in type VI secretion and phage assembly
MSDTDLAVDHAGADAADAGAAARCSYVVVARVTNNQDPKKLGRVKLEFPFWGDGVESSWARIATPMAGEQYGFCCLPEVGSEVLIVFAHGDVRHPYVLGALWNGQAKPPETNDNGKNHRRTITSRSGQSVVFDDEPGHESIALRSKGGLTVELSDAEDAEQIEIRANGGHLVRLSDNKAAGRRIQIGNPDDGTQVVIDVSKRRIRIDSQQDIELRAPNGKVRIEAREVQIESTGALEVQAGATLDINSNAPMRLNAPLIDLN